MASVQTAPNLPQGMTQAAITETYSVCIPTSSSLSSISSPTPFPSQNILTVRQKYKQLKDQGVRPDDPELLKYSNILNQVQKQQRFRHQQAEYLKQQAQQQALQGQQQQNAGETNGVNGM